MRFCSTVTAGVLYASISTEQCVSVDEEGVEKLSLCQVFSGSKLELSEAQPPNIFY